MTSQLATHAEVCEARILLDGTGSGSGSSSGSGGGGGGGSVTAADDFFSLGPNQETMQVDVFANDIPSAPNIWISEFEQGTNVQVAHTNPTGGVFEVTIEDYKTETEFLARKSWIESRIDDWEEGSKQDVQDSYDASIAALNSFMTFVGQWNGANASIISAAGNAIWAFSSYFKATTVGVAGMGLSALSEVLTADPDATSQAALLAATDLLLGQKMADMDAIEATATSLKIELNQLVAGLGNAEVVPNPTFRYTIEGFESSAPNVYYYDDATVTIDLGGRKDYTPHWNQLSAFFTSHAEMLNFIPNADLNATDIYGSMLVDFANAKSFHLHGVLGPYGNPYDPSWNTVWESDDVDGWWLDGSDIADELNAIGYGDYGQQ
jgi:hypothetical protein